MDYGTLIDASICYMTELHSSLANHSLVGIRTDLHVPNQINWHRCASFAAKENANTYRLRLSAKENAKVLQPKKMPTPTDSD